VLGRVRELIGGDPETVGQASLRVEGNVLQIENYFRLELQTTTKGTPGTRSLEAPTCKELAEAAAVLIAFTVDPEGAARASFEPKPPPPPPPEEPRLIDPGPQPQRGARVRGVTQSHALVAVGHLPSSAVGLGARIGIEMESVGLQVLFGGYNLFERSTQVEGAPGKGGEFSMLALTLDACRIVRSKAVSISPCVGTEFGPIWGSGFGVDETERRRALWLSAVAGVNFGLRATDEFSLLASGAATMQLLRPRFALREVGDVYEAPFVGGRFSLGLELLF
jgi:hypothetical protein